MIKLIVTDEYTNHDFLMWIEQKLGCVLGDVSRICSYSMDNPLYKESLGGGIMYLYDIYNAVIGKGNIKLRFINEYDNRDFQPWVSEKIGSSLNLLKTLYDNCDVEKEGAKDLLFLAIRDIVKVYVALWDINEISSDKLANFIFDNGYEGYQCLKYAFSISYNEGKIVSMIKDNMILQKISSLITEDKLNRTRIAELFTQMTSKNSWSERIQDELEEVHMGNIKWNEFYTKNVGNKPIFFDVNVPDELLEKVVIKLQKEYYNIF